MPGSSDEPFGTTGAVTGGGVSSRGIAGPAGVDDSGASAGTEAGSRPGSIVVVRPVVGAVTGAGVNAGSPTGTVDVGQPAEIGAGARYTGRIADRRWPLQPAATARTRTGNSKPATRRERRTRGLSNDWSMKHLLDGTRVSP
jgi:hypothetical protein